MTGSLVRLARAVVVVSLASACGGAFEGEKGSGGSSGIGGSAGSSGASGSAAGGSSASGGSGGGATGGSSGAIGSSGASGASGSGGNAGSGPCVPDGPCSPDGTTCTSGECCPCLYECTAGRWQSSACASCPAPGCPPEPPSHRQSCDACLDPTSAPCFWDQCPTSKIEATCDGTEWQVAEHPCVGCGCSFDQDCAAGQICVNTACKAPEQGRCWRNAECGPGAFCSGSFVCPCNAGCAYPDYSGSCVPNGQGCCGDDSDCLSGNHCVVGVCKEKLFDGTCWVDRDCPGSYCKSPSICRCGQNCLLPDVPGQCA